MPRPKKDAGLVARALDMVEGGVSPEDAVEHPDLAGKISARTIYRVLEERRAVAPLPAEPPPTADEKKVDELVAKSRTWRRVMAALTRFAQKHPEVAVDLSAELRSLDL